MKKTFREYHNFTESEFKQLLRDCLFVFDTNTLLNMYRYSRETVEAYIGILTELKNKKQLWIPYQVGYEFYENRIDVISEYEKSYDEILLIIEHAKTDIESKYKNHPFLDLCKIKEGMSQGLLSVESKIKEQKEKHPKWIDKDDVLENINRLFEGNIGDNYKTERLDEIKKEGKDRYDKKIPPGFKDNQKPEDKKYGDLILWFQIIDKAKESKKPIVLISGDVKEDWWLEKDNKRIMPLPKLKKEMLDKAGVDFHIYTADRFLEYYRLDSKKISIDEKAIKEVKKIREMEEERFRRKYIEREIEPRMAERYFTEYVHMFKVFQEIMIDIHGLEFYSNYMEELERLGRGVKYLRDKFAHGDIDRMSIHMFYRLIKEGLLVFDKIIHSENMNPEMCVRIKENMIRLENMNHRFSM